MFQDLTTSLSVKVGVVIVLWLITKWWQLPWWILAEVNFGDKSFHPLFQIWCKSVHKWLSYGHLTDFKTVAAAILDFLAYVNLDCANICKNGRLMAKSVIFNMAAAAMLDFAKYQFPW